MDSMPYWDRRSYHLVFFSYLKMAEGWFMGRYSQGSVCSYSVTQTWQCHWTYTAGSCLTQKIVLSVHSHELQICSPTWELRWCSQITPVACPLFERVTKLHSMRMMSRQMLPDNRHTHVGHAALHHGGRVPLGTDNLLSTVPINYRWMSSGSTSHKLAKIPSAFRVSCRPSSQTVDCSRPHQIIRLDPFLPGHISFTNVSDKQFKVPCDIIY